MIATLVSLVIAFFIYFQTISESTTAQATFAALFLGTGVLFLLAPLFVTSLAWSAIQRAEEKLTPRISDLFRKDTHLRGYQLLSIVFPFIMFLLAFDILVIHNFNPNALFALWVIAVGLSIDSFYGLITKISGYLDPFQATTWFEKQAVKSIQDDKELDLCEWIDATSEVGIRAIERSAIFLCNHAIESLSQMIRLFFKSSKSISHDLQTEETKALGISDKVSYTMFFLLQRLELINKKAADNHFEPVCSKIITNMGKISIAAAKYDMTLPTYPLLFLGKFSLYALKQGILDVGSKSIITLVEVAKAILTEIDVTYLELQDPFFTLLQQIHEIQKELFRQDKNTNISLLVQPFLDIKALFLSEKMAQHPDTTAIVQDIDRILAEYEALVNVMKSMPKIHVDEKT